LLSADREFNRIRFQMDEINFDILKDHSKNFQEMALRADRVEKMTTPDGYGKRTGKCGDIVEIYLRVQGGIIQRISFVVDGCIYTTACSNTVAHLVEGKRVQDAWEIGPEKVLEFLETLPQDHAHCAELSVGALYLALSNVQEIQRAPWKKMYL
jgi:nitrogen fixation NifU-like protein